MPAPKKKNPASTKKAAASKKRSVKEEGEGAPSIGILRPLLCLATVLAAGWPVLSVLFRGIADVGTSFDDARIAPLLLWLGTGLLACLLCRGRGFRGDGSFVLLTWLLCGLGIVLQMRLGTWCDDFGNVKTYLPLTAGLLLFLFFLRGVPRHLFEMLLPKIGLLCWLAALGVLGVLFFFGHSYRGGMFLPGQINPTELVKILLVAAGASLLPKYEEGLSRTVLGIPVPPLRDVLPLAVVWGVPLLGAVAVRDLGLVLILCLTFMLMLTALTRRLGWTVFGLAAAGAAGWAIRLVSAHSRARFDVWLNPFADPLNKGWQIGQSLCAQYAGGLWGTGTAEGMPGAVPIVSSDFVWAAIAEEWGLVGCFLLLAIYLVWISHAAQSASDSECSAVRLFGFGCGALLGVQILLNIGGVTKALPMTGITLPLMSQGGFSLLSTLLLCGIVTALSRKNA